MKSHGYTGIPMQCLNGGNETMMKNNPYQTATFSDYLVGGFWFILAVLFIICLIGGTK